MIERGMPQNPYTLLNSGMRRVKKPSNVEWLNRWIANDGR
jgi:hypothetical protein